ncbi:MAG: class I SAM-dependent methyltransferase [Eubacteriales bacterium]|nr:class I SAM-dependent methyltransferase [Eubacteriales bacterium]
MGAYESFASVYDMFMDNIDYPAWSEYLTGLLKKYGVSDGLVCELGCGTGNMTELLAEAGYDMIGIDLSVEMLEEALEKKYESGHDILYLNQDMREFELYGTVRAIVSVCDSMNYLLEEKDLLQVLKLANNYLDPGGVFIFDMNTEARYKGIGDSVIAENREDGSFIWENSYDEEKKLNQYVVTLFLPEEPYEDEDEEEMGVPCRRFEEVHLQKVYDVDTIRRLVEEAGMIFEGVYEAFTDHAPDERSDKIYVIAREKGK